MALVDKLERSVSIPHEEGCSMRFRPLSGREVAAAASATVEGAFLLAKKAGIGLDGLMSSGSSDTPDKPTDVQPTQANFDLEIVLKSGLISLDGPCYEGFKKSHDLKRLDKVTEDWAFTVIMGDTLVPSS